MEKVVVRRHTFNGMKEEIIKIGSSCFIGHCGSGHSVFGENGTVTIVRGILSLSASVRTIKNCPGKQCFATRFASTTIRKILVVNSSAFKILYIISSFCRFFGNLFLTIESFFSII